MSEQHKHKYNDKCVNALLDAIEAGLNINAACQIVDINRDTYWDWKREHPEFREKLEARLERMRHERLVIAMAAQKRLLEGETYTETTEKIEVGPNGITTSTISVNRTALPNPLIVHKTLSALDPHYKDRTDITSGDKSLAAAPTLIILEVVNHKSQRNDSDASSDSDGAEED